MPGIHVGTICSLIYNRRQILPAAGGARPHPHPRLCQEIMACCYKHQHLVTGGPIICPGPSSGNGMPQDTFKLMDSFMP